ncbi:MAG: hypothetical protein ACD_61C00043G0003 [uncultured bacterium]|nr:MAG: hypothetical protein ACD_61C00043G0003 [uncultured bacterium]
MFSTILLQLIVFLLPTQLGLHFWPDFARAAGIKVDYLSPTLYLTDILLVAFILLNLKPIFHWLRSHLPPTIIFLAYVLLNSVFGVSPANSIFWWLRFLLYLLFFLTLLLRKVTWSQIKTSLLISTILVIFLQVLETTRQSSIGGLFYWLGERTFSTSTPGLAHLSFFGYDFVRAPATFSHPNSLAGFLLVVYYLLHIKKSPLWQRLAVFLGLILTFSKAALLAFVLVISFHLGSLALIGCFLLISVFQIFLPNLPGLFPFISDRLFLLAPVKDIFSSSPLLGVGLGGFIPSLVSHLPGSFLLPAKIQPVHNLPLLSLLETGIVGLILLSVLIKRNLKRILKPEVLALLALIIITGAFDHYWWTLPQNKLILILAWAILL